MRCYRPNGSEQKGRWGAIWLDFVWSRDTSTEERRPGRRSHQAVVSDSEVHKADEVNELAFVGEIDDEPDEVSEVDNDELDEVSEVGEIDEPDEVCEAGQAGE